MSVRKVYPKLKVVAHYTVTVNDELVPIDPYKTDLPDRCKLALAEMVTGLKHELVNVNESSGS